VNLLDLKDAVRARDGYRCTGCGLPNAEHIHLHGRALDVHRVIPRSTYTLDGCITVCRRCHGPLPKAGPYTRDLASRLQSLHTSIHPDLAETLARVVAESDPPMTQKAVVELALRRYFASIARWPPPPPPPP
jgi:hypothetical protein